MYYDGDIARAVISQKGEIGMTLKQLRIRALLTSTEAAKRIGCGGSLYSQWETGSRTPSIASLKKIMNALGCTAEELATCETWFGKEKE